MTTSARLCLLLAALVCPVSASAGPREDALGVFDAFLAGMTAADLNRVTALFAPDALVWGTTMRDLATTPDAVRQYFSNLNNVTPIQRPAAAAGPFSTLVLSDTTVLVSGMWGFERVVDGRPAVPTPARVSLVVARRGDRWLVVQFHNSARPMPPAAPAGTAPAGAPPGNASPVRP